AAIADGRDQHVADLCGDVEPTGLSGDEVRGGSVVDAGFHTALRSSRTSPSRICSAAYRLAAATWCGASGCTALVATSRVPWSAVCRYSITRSAMSEQSMADSTNSGSRSSASAVTYSDHRPLRRQPTAKILRSLISTRPPTRRARGARRWSFAAPRTARFPHPAPPARPRRSRRARCCRSGPRASPGRSRTRNPSSRGPCRRHGPVPARRTRGNRTLGVPHGSASLHPLLTWLSSDEAGVRYRPVVSRSLGWPVVRSATAPTHAARPRRPAGGRPTPRAQSPRPRARPWRASRLVLLGFPPRDEEVDAVRALDAVVGIEPVGHHDTTHGIREPRVRALARLSPHAAVAIVERDHPGLAGPALPARQCRHAFGLGRNPKLGDHAVLQFLPA